MLNESVEALRHIATTSLFMQNEQKSSMSLSNRIVPIIKEPDIPTNAGNATISVLPHITLKCDNCICKEIFALTCLLVAYLQCILISFASFITQYLQ